MTVTTRALSGALAAVVGADRIHEDEAGLATAAIDGLGQRDAANRERHPERERRQLQEAA